jgi:YHS domain-containing protein
MKVAIPNMLGASQYAVKSLVAAVCHRAKRFLNKSLDTAVKLPTNENVCPAYICKKKLMKVLLIGLFFTCLTIPLVAQDHNRQKHFNLEKGLALRGYDPVAYFRQGKALKGKKDISAVHQSVTYYSASSENRAEFKANPSRFEPEYGGWCAYAMGESGEKVEVDPETFKIVDNKLYLFYNKYFNNTLKSWNKDEVRLKKNADVNWKKEFH